MKDGGFYKLSPAYSKLAESVGGVYTDQKTRPLYVCRQDRNNPQIYWATPTSDLNHRTPQKIDRIKSFCSLPERDIRSCYYHIGTTSRPAIFKIADSIPVTEKYIIGEYTVQGKHLVMQDKKQIAIIEKKLSRILRDEQLHPNKYEQHKTALFKKLEEELLLFPAI